MSTTEDRYRIERGRRKETVRHELTDEVGKLGKKGGWKREEREDDSADSGRSADEEAHA